jgi:6-methylsalicylate decarboxylase
MNRLRTVATTTDVHQHLWPAELIDALRRRSAPPRLRGWTLELTGEPKYRVDPRHHDVRARRQTAIDDGLDTALVSLSSPLGLELLPPAEAQPLLRAYHDGVAALPPPFRGWAAACLTDVDRSSLERELDRGFVGLQLPATALADADGYERAEPLISALVDRGRPLMIHPGPASSPARAPDWWPAIVSYVQQMYAAWYAFQRFGRPQYPELRVCFAMLAGLAPLHEERAGVRGGLRTVADEYTFLETSSYGPRAIDATVRVLGIDTLLSGSDRPYAAPSDSRLGAAAEVVLRSINPSRLLGLEVMPNAPAVASRA